MSAVPNLPEPIHQNGTLEHDLDAVLDQALPKTKRIDSPTQAGFSTASSNNASSTGFKLHDTVIENQRPLKVIVVGAGYSGIYHGIRIPERLRNVDLTIYDKNAGVGGTWFENRYPGCACDIPSHSYQYSFNPNPNWSSMYSPAPEIQAYLASTVKKYSVDRFIKLQHEIKSCNWDANTSKWKVKVKKLDTDEEFEDTSDVLIMARGGLNHIAWPQIDGLRSFKGEIMHSAAWNQDYDFTNKRIGIIGSGSSAIQIIPSLQRLPKTQLSCFIRSRTWISPPFGQAIQDELGMDGFTFSEEQRKKFQSDPDHFHAFRMKLEEGGNEIHALTIKGTEMQKGAQKHFEENMKQRLAKKPEIYEWIKPDFAPGCRRLTPGPGFLEALVEDNVSFIRDRIARIEDKGIVTEDGKLHSIDVLVCATGFHTGAPPPFPVTGIDGKELTQHWDQRATSYLSLATDAFPNLFMMLGPNSAIGSGSLTMMIESVGDYVIKCIRKIQKENIYSMVVKSSRVADFLAYSDAYFKNTVFMDECKSWYRKGDIVTGLWPGSTLHCIEALRSPRWEDFEYGYAEEVNQMAWLGNGWSTNQLEGRDLAFYLMPQFQQVPVSPLPEDNGEFKIRAWSQ
ncbi:FAD/NAD(P)-binding domain-containing protein [Aureobasidium pullulans]|uniref:L-ornithine N(5)-monooxygenase [NAD(P)H] n=1 Tax=Aureobasidium pullulans TaxID=5580 RepID=A0A4S9C6Z5_AURPU|nr:FAD/NAD(P)-binding domain-containing protein [Aureobasidium pullulans]